MTNSAEQSPTSDRQAGRWEFACMISDLPEDALVEVQVSDVTVLMLRHQGKVLAYPPSCPHMEEPLKNGLFDGDECVITCTKHLWQWDAKSGEPIGLAECPLLKYELKTEQDGSVFLNIENEITYDFR